MNSTPKTQLNHSGWKADLQLTFSQASAGIRRTVLSKRRFFGPLVVQKPFYPEQDVCHVYLLHPPGGIVGGDNLKISLDLQPSAHSLLTTPGANKFYRSEDYAAGVEQTFDIGADACLEWLPQESIFFNGSNAQIRSRFNLHPTGKLITWEILCFGRPASDESYQRGLINQRLELFLQQKRCFTDHLMVRGGGESMRAAWGLYGFPVAATMLLYPGLDTSIEQLMAELSPLNRKNQQEIFTSNAINKFIVCRYLGYHGEKAKQALTQAWDFVRPLMLKKPPVKPRIWST